MQPSTRDTTGEALIYYNDAASIAFTRCQHERRRYARLDSIKSSQYRIRCNNGISQPDGLRLRRRTWSFCGDLDRLAERGRMNDSVLSDINGHVVYMVGCAVEDEVSGL